MSKSKSSVKTESKVDDESTQDQVEKKRRKAVGQIVASTGIFATMSGNWKKPVLTSAILPAHASATDCPDSDDSDSTDCDGDLPASDVHLKTNIQKLDSDAIPFQLYRFEYRSDPNRKTYVGVLAQHLEESHPKALSKNPEGFFRVNYGALGLKMATLEEWNEKGIDAVIKLH